MSQRETQKGPGIWRGDTEDCGALETSRPGELSGKRPIKEEITSLKGKAVLLSPPTPGPVGFSHFCTHQRFVSDLALT